MEPGTGLLQDHSQIGGDFLVTWDINANGAVVGAGMADGAVHAKIWIPGDDTGLDTDSLATGASAPGADVGYMIGPVGARALPGGTPGYSTPFSSLASNSGYRLGPGGSSGGFGGGGGGGTTGTSIPVSSGGEGEAVPEPTTMALWILVLAVFYGQRLWRRRRQTA